MILYGYANGVRFVCAYYSFQKATLPAIINDDKDDDEVSRFQDWNNAEGDTDRGREVKVE